jgi:hypothetical protein
MRLELADLAEASNSRMSIPAAPPPKAERATEIEIER